LEAHQRDLQARESWARTREETDMDFIERLFGVAPDGGNGTLELLYIVVAGLAVGASILQRRLREMLASRTS